jgi:drug/metabolite transporter (DMT)-like permease
MVSTIYWLLAAVSAYLFFGLASLCDKLVLSGKPKPKSYTFYVGLLGLFVIFLIPFAEFAIPGPLGFLWIILDALVHVAGLYATYVAIRDFDVSRVIAIIGATQPVFIFMLTWIFWGPQAMPLYDLFAFLLLLFGSIVISIEKNIKITGKHLKITLLSSLMFSLDYIFAKLVFSDQTFLSGVIWIGIFIFLAASLLLFQKSAREEIFDKKIVLEKKTQTLFVSAQVLGGAGNFLQSFAISLAPVFFLATINSLRGIQYVFLFLTTLFFSVFYPKILKEEISARIIIQKIVSIILIAVGLAVLVIY